MNAALSFQDCERKTPPVTHNITLFDAKPAGIDLKFVKDIDPRTGRPNVYIVSLTPAIGMGKWTSSEDEGDIEHVKQTKLPQGTRVEGLWVEAGERRVFVLEYV